MILLYLWIGIFLLYWRTLKYNYIIDDYVVRDGYLYDVPLSTPQGEDKDGKNFFDRRPSVWYRIFMIGMHCVNTTVIYLLWGWAPAVLFAVHPVGVWGTAWVTGNYYATTTYFSLIAFYILHTFPNVYGSLAACALYAAALNSTIEALAFPFVVLACGNIWGLALLQPLAMFLIGKRFTTGMKIREGFINEKRIKGFSPRRLILMAKVTGRYLFTCLYPDRLGFFGPFGANIHDNQECYDKMHSANKEFWLNLLLCVVMFTVGILVSPVGTMWMFGFIALHSQWKIMGQFFAVRYLYIVSVGMCVIVGTMLAPYPILLAILATYYTIRTHIHIFAFRNVESIYQNDADTWPEHAQVWNNLGQFYMRDKPNALPAWKVNMMAQYILKAQILDPKAWEINMNVACFYAIIGQWHLCLQYTDIAIDLLTPLADKPCGPLQQLIAQRERIVKDAMKSVAKPEATKEKDNAKEAIAGNR